MTTTMQSNQATCSTARPSASCSPTPRGQWFRPNVDILETPEAFLIHADIPGATTENVSIHLENGELTIHARIPRRQPDGARRLHQEYCVGDYQRSFRVSDAIDGSRIEATVADGQVTLRLPKTEAVRTRKIPVTNG